MHAQPPLPLHAWPPEALVQTLVEAGLRPGQARGAVKGLCDRLWRQDTCPDEALAAVPRTAHALVQAVVAPDRPLTLVEDVAAPDRTRKLLLRTHDGHVIESVIIPADSGGRTTVCVSSQVGCGRRCAFCETGRLGLVRNLHADEIVQQVRHAQKQWAGVRGDLPEISNVVFMGMGEPLDNLDAVVDAVAILNHPYAFGLSARRITVSTVGVAHRLPEFFARCKAHLAVSLHAPDDARRTALMPVNAHCDLQTLQDGLRKHLPPGRDVLIEYILFDRLNSSLQDATLLRQWLDGLPARVNLIPANPGPDPTLRPPVLEDVRAFQKALLDAGIRTMVRHPHGRDVGGACGQLAGAYRAALQRGESLPRWGLYAGRRATDAA